MADSSVLQQVPCCGVVAVLTIAMAHWLVGKSAASVSAAGDSVAESVEALLNAARARAAELRGQGRKAPMTVVLTGGPGVGKTTLLNHLQARLPECAVVPEAAMRAIDMLNGMLGKDGQRSWRTDHRTAFGDLVGRIALAQEAKAVGATSSSDGETSLHFGGGEERLAVFFDRTVLDNIGYSVTRGYPLPGYLDVEVASTATARVDLVFILDPVASAKSLDERNAASGRQTDATASAELSAALEHVYSRLGCKTLRLPAGTTEQRAQIVLRTCGLE